MLATSGSSALSAWLFLITLAATIYRSAGQPLQLIACSQPDSFTVQITENENVVVYGTELLIKYNPRVGLYPLPGADAVNVVYNESTIEFKGYMSPEYPTTLPWGSPERLSWTSSGIILGTSTLQRLSGEDYSIQECHLFLPKNIKSSDNLPFVVKDKIANHARYCIERYLCKELGRIKIGELQNIDKYHRSASYAVDSDNSTTEPRQNCTLDSLNLNEPLNLGIKIIVSYVEKNNIHRITIPNLDESVVLGPFGMKAYFKAINGTFEDLSTLKRTEDARISGVRRNHVIKFGFGLGKARFDYDYYQVKYGIMNLSGKLTGIIDGFAVSIGIIINYDEECPAKMEHIKVTIGDIKVQMTGLGPINGATSKIVSWLTNMLQNNVVSLIEVNVKRTIDELLKEYACTSRITEMLVKTSPNISILQ